VPPASRTRLRAESARVRPCTEHSRGNDRTDTPRASRASTYRSPGESRRRTLLDVVRYVDDEAANVTDLRALASTRFGLLIPRWRQLSSPLAAFRCRNKVPAPRRGEIRPSVAIRAGPREGLSRTKLGTPRYCSMEEAVRTRRRSSGIVREWRADLTGIAADGGYWVDERGSSRFVRISRSCRPSRPRCPE